jgi:uncharacterized metal-binding protein
LIQVKALFSFVSFNQTMNEHRAFDGVENRDVVADAAKCDGNFVGAAPARKLTVVCACSGCSDAGELADRAARSLAQAKLAEMSCLAGIGGRVNSLMTKAERAENILVIDGCPLNCARKTLELAGFQNFQHLELHKLGIRKGFCPVTSERITLVTEAAAKMISESSYRMVAFHKEATNAEKVLL